jgi:hypothetical protein
MTALEVGIICGVCPKLGKWVYSDGKDSVWQTGINPATDGVCFQYDGITYLTENGYAIQTKYRCIYGNAHREEWPARPWAPVHIMCVSAGQSHATVLLGDGTVLDPLYDAPRLVTDYAKVESINAVWKVA